ncbi:hypothetical protein HanRHA438_Chr08g0339821 [Helianthus annuus]|nr:hypothetical protein HanRHA438_Chr08g0339821 [Helianthus annuus]
MLTPAFFRPGYYCLQLRYQRRNTTKQISIASRFGTKIPIGNRFGTRLGRYLTEIASRTKRPSNSLQYG